MLAIGVEWLSANSGSEDARLWFIKVARGNAVFAVLVLVAVAGLPALMWLCSMVSPNPASAGQDSVRRRRPELRSGDRHDGDEEARRAASQRCRDGVRVETAATAGCSAVDTGAGDLCATGIGVACRARKLCRRYFSTGRTLYLPGRYPDLARFRVARGVGAAQSGRAVPRLCRRHIAELASVLSAAVGTYLRCTSCRGTVWWLASRALSGDRRDVAAGIRAGSAQGPEIHLRNRGHTVRRSNTGARSRRGVVMFSARTTSVAPISDGSRPSSCST